MSEELTLEQTLDTMTVEGQLYEKLENNAVRCTACAHRCLIKDGRRGICHVRFNQGGELRVPWGYVGPLNVDPTEKKPFFHILPGSQTLTFGMLGCNLHCTYCFVGDTLVVTDRGPITLADAFASAQRVQTTPDAQIAYPNDLQAVTASGNLHKVRAVFKHPYQGKLANVQPYHLPALQCTPDHRIYATDDPAQAPSLIRAEELTDRHYLVAPKHYRVAEAQTVGVLETMGEGAATFQALWDRPQSQRSPTETDDFFLVPLRNVTFSDYEGDVYNMEVEEEHNYLAGFLLVSNCQNWVTSQTLRDPEAGIEPQPVTADVLVKIAKRYGAQLVASSYNEPLITSEWAAEIFRQTSQAGLRNMYVSSGNITREVLDYIRPYLIGYKIDLKSMNDKNYRKLGTVLNHVLDGIKMVHAVGLWMEIVTLVVPGFNDSNEELWDAARFLVSVSPDIPWHLTAFHRDYKMQDHDNTDAKTLLRAAEIGQEAGLRYVYAGNLPGMTGTYENTYCHSCSELLVSRRGFHVLSNKLAGTGRCPKCNTAIPGVWK